MIYCIDRSAERSWACLGLAWLYAVREEDWSECGRSEKDCP